MLHVQDDHVTWHWNLRIKNHCSSNMSCARMPTQVAQLQLDERVQENLDRRCLIVAIHKMMQHRYEIASFQQRNFQILQHRTG